MVTCVAIACLEWNRNKWNYFYCQKLHIGMSYTYDHNLLCVSQWEKHIESYSIILSVIFPPPLFPQKFGAVNLDSSNKCGLFSTFIFWLGCPDIFHFLWCFLPHCGELTLIFYSINNHHNNHLLSATQKPYKHYFI